MVDHVVIAFLLKGGEVEAAARSRSGAVHVSQFQNTEAGVKAFARWLEVQRLLSDSTIVDSCVATTGAQDAGFFTSPFVSLANEATRNTFIWSAAKLGSISTATGMVSVCATEHKIGTPR